LNWYCLICIFLHALWAIILNYQSVSLQLRPSTILDYSKLSSSCGSDLTYCHKIQAQVILYDQEMKLFQSSLFLRWLSNLTDCHYLVYVINLNVFHPFWVLCQYPIFVPPVCNCSSSLTFEQFLPPSFSCFGRLTHQSNLNLIHFIDVRILDWQESTAYVLCSSCLLTLRPI